MLLNVLCDDHVTGVLAQSSDTSHSACPAGRGVLHTKLSRATGVINTVLFKCFQGKKQLDYVQLQMEVFTGSIQLTQLECSLYKFMQLTNQLPVLPILQLIQASIGGPPNTGTLLSPLPLHQLIVNQGFLGKFGGIQQLYYFENDFLKGEKDTQWNKHIFNHRILFFPLNWGTKPSGYKK